jgi:environmental stress-induced protein Ves
MRIRQRTARDFRVQPWKNGGGRTTELEVEPEGSSQFLWRLSIADVERSGPFSDFAGYKRTIMLLEGDGMALTFDGTEPHRIAEPHRPFVFDGGWKTECRLLGGPVRDLNLMVERSRAWGSLQAMTLERPIEQVLGARWELVLPLRGAAEADADGKTYRLQPGELLRLDDAQGRTLAIRPLEPGSCLAHIAIDLETPVA